MEKCVITGTFDPFTNGHKYILDTACKLFMKVYVVIFVNPDKTSLFTVAERLEMLNALVKDYKNVETDASNGYVKDWCKAHDVNVVLRGVRNCDDYEYEKIMAEYNRKHGNVTTLFVKGVDGTCSHDVRNMIENGEDYGEYVPKSIAETIKNIIGRR